LCGGTDDGCLEIDNNVAERASRIVAVERRIASRRSKTCHARAVAIYTVIQTCKANGIDPQAYIARDIARILSNW